MKDLVIVATFTDTDGQPLELVRLLSNNAELWSQKPLPAPHVHTAIWLLKDRISNHIQRGHSTAPFALRRSAADPTFLDAFALVDDAVTTDEERRQRIVVIARTRMADRAIPLKLVDQIMLWAIVDLCQLDPAEDIFERALFENNISTPVPDAQLEQIRTSEAYVALRCEQAAWDRVAARAAQADGDDYLQRKRKSVSRQLRQLKKLASTVLGDTRIDAMMHEGETEREQAPDIDWTTFLMWHLAENYSVSLFTHHVGRPFTHGWLVDDVAHDQDPHAGRILPDLLDAFIVAGVIVPESQYEAWLDEHILQPDTLGVELDLEPYLLLEEQVPWLWNNLDLAAYLETEGLVP